jgi:hypothetical protein
MRCIIAFVVIVYVCFCLHFYNLYYSIFVGVALPRFIFKISIVLLSVCPEMPNVFPYYFQNFFFTVSECQGTVKLRYTHQDNLGVPLWLKLT